MVTCGTPPGRRVISGRVPPESLESSSPDSDIPAFVRHTEPGRARSRSGSVMHEMVMSSGTIPGRRASTIALACGLPPASAASLGTLAPPLYREDSDRDVTRNEEKWSDVHEEFLKNILTDCSKSAAKHSDKVDSCRRYFQALSVPSFALPLISAVLTQNGDSGPVISYVSSALLVVSSITAGANTLFNFGKLCQQHDEFAGRFAELSAIIEYTLTRKRRNREACDTTIQRFVGKLHALRNAAPSI